MTSTYTQERNPWIPNGHLQKRLNVEANARQLASNAIDSLGVVSVYAGRNWEGNNKNSGFPGRALITKRSDPAKNLKLPHVPLNHSSRRRNSTSVYFEDEQQQQEQQRQYDNDNSHQQNQQQQQSFNEQFNQQYHPHQQEQQNDDNNGKFEYAGMSELDFIRKQMKSGGVNNSSSSSMNQQNQQQREQAYSDEYQPQQQQQQQNEVDQRRIADNSNNKFYENEINRNNNDNEMMMMTEEQIRQIEDDQRISQQYGVYTQNSFRDIRRARECKYGIRSESLYESQARYKNGNPPGRRSSNNNNNSTLHPQDISSSNNTSSMNFMPENEEEAEEFAELEHLSPQQRRRRIREIERQRAYRHLSAPVPLDPRDYPVQPTFTPTAALSGQKPLAFCEKLGKYVYRGDAESSFPRHHRAHENEDGSLNESKNQAIHRRMEERKTGKSAALHKALEEIKYHDRALLVNVPWQFANHKNNQTYYRGGGSCPEAQVDFLEKNAVN